MSTAKTVPGFSLNSFVAPKEDWYKTLNLQDSIDMAKEKMVEAAENFVAVGYYLKHIRDEKLYKNKGYKNIWECAERELKLAQSTASRYINICEKFSSNGNSPYLDEKFKEYGKSQLQELLSISDQKLIEQVTPDMSVRQIQKLKKGNTNEKNDCVQAGQPEKHKEDVYTALPGQMQMVVDGTFREIEPEKENIEEEEIKEEKPEESKSEEEPVNIETTSQTLTYNNDIMEQSHIQEEQSLGANQEAELIGGYDMSLIDKLILKYKTCRRNTVFSVEKIEMIHEYDCLLDALVLLKRETEGQNEEK